MADLIIGLTGGIASGKSTVARRFTDRGITVVDADEISRAVVEPGQPALEHIVEAFGPEALDASGCLDRARLREIIFSDPEQRRRLEEILHPAIGAEMARRIAAAPGPYVIMMVPLLAETAGRDRADRVLVVDVPEEVQIMRLVERDGVTAEQARAALDVQASRQQRLDIADDVIRNDGSVDALDRQVEALHRLYLRLARGEPAPEPGLRSGGGER
ncbi:MAG TPA: dephospho-CoA kinase [Gammaproteobacteria bacterium]|nr:dephospho-CoA kinase [Gammaproteobacteria bacterium]